MKKEAEKQRNTGPVISDLRHRALSVQKEYLRYPHPVLEAEGRTRLSGYAESRGGAGDSRQIRVSEFYILGIRSICAIIARDPKQIGRKQASGRAEPRGGAGDSRQIRVSEFNIYDIKEYLRYYRPGPKQISRKQGFQDAPSRGGAGDSRRNELVNLIFGLATLLIAGCPTASHCGAATTRVSRVA